MIFIILITFSLVNAQWDPNLNNGLFAYYNFSGIHDQISGLNLTEQGNVTYPSINAKMNQSGINNETDELNTWKIHANNTPFFFNKTKENLTINFWIWFHNNATNNENGLGASSLVDRRKLGGWEILYNTAKNITAIGFSGTDLVCARNSGFAPQNKTWFMITVTKNISHACLFYNATLCDCQAEQNITVHSNLAENLTISGDIDNSTAKRLMIDELGFWNRSLNTSEINSLYNSGTGAERIDLENPSLTINEPNTTYNDITNVPINISARDDIGLSYCYFNITRGASLEVANTQITNCVYTTFTVSGDANYIAHVFVNDTKGKANYTSASFTITNYVPPSSSSGGGGGGGFQITNIINTLSGEIKTPICDELKPQYQQALDNFLKETSFKNFRTLWFAFWNLGICKNSASIIPLEVEKNQTF